MTQTQSKFLAACNAYWCDNPLALNIVHGVCADGSYEQARADFKAYCGHDGLEQFDRDAMRIYRETRIALETY